MIKNALKNWRTTSLGLSTIIMAIVGLVYAIKAHQDNPTVWAAAVSAVMTGIGLVASGDSAASAAAHEETKVALTAITDTIQTTATAAARGDTAMLNKVAASVPLVVQPPPPEPFIPKPAGQSDIPSKV